jgi:cellulose synthase/poly-beta-1,6-N-acetylglucosamine synthase-like glycosyltransferase
MKLKKLQTASGRIRRIIHPADSKAQHNKSVTAIVLFVFITFLLIYAGFSNTIFIIVSVLGIIVILHILLKLSAAIKPSSESLFEYDKNYTPFVSVHVACKNEPASIVNSTVAALTKLDYKNYEVIVINSNNQDEDNWMKIKKYVESCGDNYIFVHLDKISGFKAGALNYLNNNLMSKKADIVAIVDCDYIVTPDFLSKTVGYFKNPKVGIVQAPQDYHNVDQHNIGLFYEYRSFFTLVMHQAQRFQLVNFTGTMGLIRAKLLLEKGLRWNEWCITEDTEAGTHINSIGYRGVYVDDSVGKGLMPLDYTSLIKQRQRWVYGNAQIIGKDLYSVMLNKAFTAKQKLSFVSQLVTWFHFELIIAFLYLMTTIAMALGLSNHNLLMINDLLILALLVSVVGNFLYFIVGMRNETSIINRIKTFFAHYGLIYVMSSGWLIYLAGHKLGFNVTSKERIKNGLNLKQLSHELATSIIFAIAIIINIFFGGATVLDITAIALFVSVELVGVFYLNRSFITNK